MHFFLEHTFINNETSAYGPDSTNPATKYNVTTRFSLNGKMKAFACQESMMLVLPATDDNLVNVILKPIKGSSHFPKVQYYVYRGLLKKDFIDDNVITPTGANNTDFIKDFWKKVNDFNLKSPVIKLEPTPASLGYTGLSETADIEDLFLIVSNLEVKEGAWFGNFENNCGFEIITETEEQQIDLAYLKKSSHQIDISELPNTEPAEAFAIKKEKEKILNYIDPAAFWGTFYEKGINVWDSTTNQTTEIKEAALYDAVISKYSTKNKIYLDIRGTTGRSYNFDGNDGQISFDPQGTVPSVQIDYATDGWPIIIKQIAPSEAPIPERQFSFNYNIDENVIEEDIVIQAYCHFPFDEREHFFSSDELVRKTSDVPPVPILVGESNFIDKIPVKSVASPEAFSPVANYYKIEIINDQTQPIVDSFNAPQSIVDSFNAPQPVADYYNNLWKVDRIDSVVAQNLAQGNYAYWKVSSKSRLVNLLALDIKNAKITNKIFFDKGKKEDTTKTRRLYVAAITRASRKNKNLVIHNLTSGEEKNLTKNNYIFMVYNSVNYRVYKGKIEDGAAVINALSFINDDDFELKQSYLQIGITDEEYNKLLYDNIVVPNPLPETHVPQDASNIYLYLKEETTVPYKKVFWKYRLGVKYVNNAGVQKETFPTLDIFVYTIDGLYFFTKEYADYQQFYEEFAKAKVSFRTLPMPMPVPPVPPVPTYNGEFGFDWLREGDVGEHDYQTYIEGGYERSSPTDLNKEYEDKVEAFKFLRKEYQIIPTQTKEELYFTPYLRLYSKPESDKAHTIPLPPHQADLRVLVKIEAGENIEKLVFDYDKTIFTLDKNELQVADAPAAANVKIKISCKKDFTTNKYIKVFAKKGIKKQLAGQIAVCKNSLINRKEIEFVLVKVTTDINNCQMAVTGEYGPFERRNLINTMHQLLINAVVADGPNVDVSDRDDYKVTGTVAEPVYGKFIYKKIAGDKFLDRGLDYEKNKGEIYDDIKTEFFALSGTRKYKRHFFVFSFLEKAKNPKALGKIRHNGIREAAMFAPRGSTPANPTGRDDTTLNHESCHGLGLHHTHRNVENGISIPLDPVAKYIYPRAPAPGSTDNVVSDSSNALTLWYWQWKIIKSKMK